MFKSRNAATQTGLNQEPTELTSVHNTSNRINVFACPSILECPICNEYAMPPIYQCVNGHIMCFRCRALITTCPVCGSKMGDLIRNRQIEQIAQILPFPCKFKIMGCPSLLPYKELAEHEKYCNYRPVTCPHRQNCKWIGPLSSLVQHLSIGKPKLIEILNGDSVKFPAACALDPSLFSEWRMIQCCFGESFMFILLRDFHKGATQFYALVHILGTKKQSSKFTYSLELNSDNGTALAWKSIPIPYHDGIVDAVLRSKCLVFDIYTAKNFSKDDVLTFNVKILMKTQQ